MKPTLIFGYGNFDREDDGVAWHILLSLAKRLGQPFPETPEEELPEYKQYPHFMFDLQLYPELAETIAQYQRVVFVDAHTGIVPNDLNIAEVSAQFQKSPLTHHMTPATVLEFSKALYHAEPETILVSVKGYQFGFSRNLSEETSALANQAVDYIESWLNHEAR
jgi:hydrogenase maturation protease